jgi:hypothetical protein
MASPKVDLDIHKEFIKSLYLNRNATIDNTTAILIKRTGQAISRRILERKLNNWD